MIQQNTALQTSDDSALDSSGLDLLFADARTYSTWLDRDISEDVLHTLYHNLKFAPTSANCCPARFVFVKSKEAKERLKPHLAEGNVDKTMVAPVTVIIGQDMKFYEHLPKLFPHTDAKSWFIGKEDYIRETAFRNASLQGGYLIMVARALGLDCGPMSGFDSSGVRKEFFDGTDIEPNFLCNLGYGDPSGLHPRSPRFEFDEVCEVL